MVLGGAFSEMKALGVACSWLDASVRWELLSAMSFVHVSLPGGSLSLTPWDHPQCDVGRGSTCLQRVVGCPLDIFLLSFLQTR